MDHPSELRELLEELQASAADRSVPSLGKDENAHAVVRIDRRQLFLNRRQCDLLFETPEAAELFFSAIGLPNASELVLHRVNIVDEEVSDVLANLFDTVVVENDDEEDEP